MGFVVYFTLFILLLATSPAAQSSSALVDLTSLNFDGVVDGSSHVLVAFVAPWCPHSRALAPDLNKVAAHFYARPSDEVIVARCDATVDFNLEQRFGVDGYPSLFFFRKRLSGLPAVPELVETRSAVQLASFIVNRAGLSASALFSEPISDIVALTAANFDAVVYDPSTTGLYFLFF
jgi:thiol-disulfide isomerase/thioredoxin